MKEEIDLHGVVLSSAPIRDYDKRLCLLTAERGKVTAWASGAKRPGSPLMAGTRNFVFGDFAVTEGRSGYNLKRVKVKAYFEEIALDLENACFGSYFLEFAESVAQEELPAEEMLHLLYLSLRAVLHPKLSNVLVRRIFELRMLLLSGEYTEDPPGEATSACVYTWRYVLSAALPKLYTFTLQEELLSEFADQVDVLLRRIFPGRFRSLEILETLAS